MLITTYKVLFALVFTLASCGDGRPSGAIVDGYRLVDLGSPHSTVSKCVDLRDSKVLCEAGRLGKWDKDEPVGFVYDIVEAKISHVMGDPDDLETGTFLPDVLGPDGRIGGNLYRRSARPFELSMWHEGKIFGLQGSVPQGRARVVGFLPSGTAVLPGGPLVSGSVQPLEDDSYRLTVNGVANDGTILGFVHAGSTRAAIYVDGEIRLLGCPEGGSSAATAGANGWVAGKVWFLAKGSPHWPALWRGAGADPIVFTEVLGVAKGGAAVFDVNGAGVFVGRMNNGASNRAMIGDVNGVRDLNELVPTSLDLVLVEAVAIDDAGRVAVTAATRGSYEAAVKNTKLAHVTRAVLLSPR